VSGLSSCFRDIVDTRPCCSRCGCSRAGEREGGRRERGQKNKKRSNDSADGRAAERPSFLRPPASRSPAFFIVLSAASLSPSLAPFFSLRSLARSYARRRQAQPQSSRREQRPSSRKRAMPPPKPANQRRRKGKKNPSLLFPAPFKTAVRPFPRVLLLHRHRSQPLLEARAKNGRKRTGNSTRKRDLPSLLFFGGGKRAKKALAPFWGALSSHSLPYARCLPVLASKKRTEATELRLEVKIGHAQGEEREGVERVGERLGDEKKTCNRKQTSLSFSSALPAGAKKTERL